MQSKLSVLFQATGPVPPPLSSISSPPLLSLERRKWDGQLEGSDVALVFCSELSPSLQPAPPFFPLSYWQPLQKRILRSRTTIRSLLSSPPGWETASRLLVHMSTPSLPPFFFHPSQGISDSKDNDEPDPKREPKAGNQARVLSSLTLSLFPCPLLFFFPLFL